MVVFTCDACGESLKKNQVEKHYTTKCRRCSVLSCMDCGKDFKGDSYKEHTKCISEEEKYSGQDWKPKPNANKGEKKQEQWTEQVEAAIRKCRNPKLKPLLHKLSDFPNVPKKKPKFINFVGNCMKMRPFQAEEIWQVLMEHKEEQDRAAQANGNSVDIPKELPTVEDHPTENGGDHEKKLNKREKKEERQRLASKGKKSKHIKDSENTEDADDTQKVKKKKKKRKHEDDEGDKSDDNSAPIDAKRIKTDVDDCEEDRLSASCVEEEEEPKKPGKIKFSWEDNIAALLKKKGEISLKKLRKKVVAEYISQGGFVKSEEKLLVKVEKKVTKNPMYKVHKEKVKFADT